MSSKDVSLGRARRKITRAKQKTSEISLEAREIKHFSDVNQALLKDEKVFFLDVGL